VHAGREALMAAHRFLKDFDGIVAGAGQLLDESDDQRGVDDARAEQTRHLAFA
jgi:hypothetical protein